MKRSFPGLLLLMVLALPALAQTIVTKDGGTMASENLQRQGNAVAATVKLPGGGSAQVAVPVANIAEIRFPIPPILDTAPMAIANGDAAKVLEGLDALIKAQADFKDIPGNLWAQATLKKIMALASPALNRTEEAKGLLADLLAGKPNPGILAQAKFLSITLSAQDDPQAALDGYDALIRDPANASRPALLAELWVAKGKAHYALEQYDEALMDYLTVTVFYSEQKNSQSPALLGSARAYVKLQEPKNAIKSFQQIVDSWPDTPEAIVAKAELKKGKL